MPVCAKHPAGTDLLTLRSSPSYARVIHVCAVTATQTEVPDKSEQTDPAHVESVVSVRAHIIRWKKAL